MSQRTEVLSSAVLFTVAVLSTGCGNSDSRVTEAEIPEKVVNVELWTVVPGRIEGWIDLPGKLEPDREVTVGAEVDGVLEWIGTDKGERVTKGQKLAVIDRENLELTYRQAELALEQARISAERVRIGVEQAELTVEGARSSTSEAAARVAQAVELERKARAVRDQAARERDRIEALFSEQLAPRSRRDDLEAALEIASADLSSAIEGVKAARAGLVVLDTGSSAAETALKAAREELSFALSQVKTAEANFRQARLFLDRSTIQAPLGGTVETSFFELGELVNANDPLFRIVRLEPIVAVFPLPEKDVSFLRTGMEAAVTVGSLSPQPFTGTVRFLGVTSDPATNTYRLEVELRNAERILKPGMLARLSLLRQAFDDAVAVPLYAVVNEEGGSQVFVYEEGLARRRRVKTGIIDGDRVQITDGLSPGERLIVKGQRDLEDGQKVAAP